ncbi:UDP-phosphate galactose phosphotransferase, partial [Enterococcus faecium]
MTALNDRFEVAANIVPIPAKLPAWQRGYSRRLIALDFVAVVSAIGLAQWLRFGGLGGEVSSFRSLDYAFVS